MNVSHFLIALGTFCLTLAASLLFVSRSINIAHHLGILDKRESAHIHNSPVPRFGGAAVFLAFSVGLASTFVLNVERNGAEIERLLLLLAGAAIVTAVMVYDDILGITPIPKLLLQMGAAAIVVLPRLHGSDHGIVIEQFNAPFFGVVHLPLLLGLPFSVFWIVGMMNTMNFVDGLDGLASSVTLVACAVLFAHTYFWPREAPQYTISLLAATLGASVLGFLWFNWHPAKIILGDAGANFLGFALAVVAIIGGAKIATALLALGLPILDVAWVILYRLMHGRSPLRGGDRGHLHHRLLDSGWTQPQVVSFVAGVSAIFGLGALLLPDQLTKLVALGVLAIVLLGTVSALAMRDRHRRTTPRKDVPA